MMNVLLLGYIAVLALFVWLGLIPFNRFWKFSPVIVALALGVALAVALLAAILPIRAAMGLTIRNGLRAE